ncbi:hypothetical protein LVD17_12255 [Fulvivirga ulvae]|uniref:hypothetical protein n=1 Tax=Fulvivirga ulvae TaxID=2904245 RepID=UPI001F340D0A|nr:hypothetical protein [Fulvivirga ulvae]UII34580.1 hypothetical protein LVD17_12255 [Fulvivirga ulvae]
MSVETNLSPQKTSATHLRIHFPSTVNFAAAEPGAESGFSVESVGTGSFTGLAYTVPAHTKGTLKAKIQVMALTSADISELNGMVMNMLAASEKSKIESYQRIHASANLSFFGFLSGGGEASYDRVDRSMKSLGLTEDQISTIIDKMFQAAQKMSHVELDFTIDNTANDYSVSGDLQLYTIAGQISSKKGTTQYRMLADQGTAGNGSAKATGKVIPLS